MSPRLVDATTVSVPAGVEFDDDGDVWRLRATRDLGAADLQDGSASYADPRAWVSVGTRTVGLRDLAMVGFAATQFALPVRAEPGSNFDFDPAPGLRSPPVALPLLLFAPDGTVELLAPLGSWHEQVIRVHQSTGIDELRWGWHGDLAEAHAGFCTELGIFTGDAVGEVLARWGERVRRAAGTQRAAPGADPALTHLSYWTDNGAAYWYRTEPGLDLPTTLERKLAELRQLGVGVRSVELDSWFYPHEISRPIGEVGYLDAVPPTGMMTWTPRPDVLPDGVDGLRSRLGNPPLVLHSRHISRSSPYLERGEWWTDVAAHPADPRFFRQWFDDARAWGATCIEQDWMMATFFGVRDVRAVPGRALEWQLALDRMATESGLHLIWCMALPADIAATVELSNVIAVRTCDDYRFAADPAVLWVWYLTVNALCSVLELAVFKDCFFTATTDDLSGSETSYEPASDAGIDAGIDADIDGDPHAEVEALLSAMSGGVVGIGDRIGRTDTAIVSRLCRPDGLLTGPDRPITLTDAAFRDAGRRGDALCWASTVSGRWTYVIALHVATTDEPVLDRHRLDDPALVYDWRRGTAAVATTIEIELGHRDWALFVCCPIDVDARGARTALIGDPHRYATMSRSRVDVSGPEPIVLAADGESPPPLRWWSDELGVHDR